MASERGGMMSDLISRKLISDYLREQHAQVIIEKHKDGFITDDVCKGMECSIDAFVNFISQCPTVDAVPVRDIEKAIDNIGVIARASNNTNFINGCTASLNELYKALTPQKVDGKKVQE